MQILALSADEHGGVPNGSVVTTGVTGICNLSGQSMKNIPLTMKKIATKCFFAFSGSTRYIKQHTKSLPRLKHHKGSNYDVKETIAQAKMWLLEFGV